MLLEHQFSTLLLIDVQEKLLPLVAQKEEVIKNCQWMLALANKLSVPIVVTEQYPQGLGGTVNEFSSLIADAKRYSKTTFSAVADLDFSMDLQKANREHYVLIGIETHACVLQTALELRARNKQVFVIIDATSSRHEKDKRLALNRLAQAGVQLISREMVFFEWLRDAKHDDFKSLSRIFLQ